MFYCCLGGASGGAGGGASRWFQQSLLKPRGKPFKSHF